MPLTLQGIAVQILGSIRTHRDYPSLSSINDCKVVVNHLIRKFSEPLSRNSRQKHLCSSKAASTEGGGKLKDHAVPVIIILEQLLQLPDDKLAINESNIRDVMEFLGRSLMLVEITRDEDALLNSMGLTQRMPATWSTPGHEHFGDALARYKVAGIEIMK